MTEQRLEIEPRPTAEERRAIEIALAATRRTVTVERAGWMHPVEREA